MKPKWKRKTCGLCKCSKWLHEFPTHRETRDGRHTYCRDCLRTYQRERNRRVRGSKPRTKHDPSKPKICARCKTLKNPEEFPRDPKRPDALYSYCRICKQEDAKERRVRYHAEGRACQWNLARAAKKLGTTVEIIHELLAKQKNKCAICGGQATGNHGRLVIDHDHKTGKVRGMLCGHCNNALGMLNDDPKLLQKAIDYLNKHKPRRTRQ